MKTKSIVALGILIGIVAALASLFAVQSAPRAAVSDGQHLEGSWIVNAVANLPGQPHLTGLLTFTADGSAVGTPGLAIVVSNAHGVWQRLGNRTFAVTLVYLRRDDAGEFIGTSKIRSTLTLDESSALAEGQFEISVFDLGGNQVGGFGGKFAATRIQSEPLN
jgi:hypothetical protein